MWVESLETFGSFMCNGAESFIYKSYDEKEVYKIKLNRTGGINGFVNLLKDALNHNKVFPDTYYSLIGFSSYRKDLCVILRQEYVRGEFATNEQIQTHLMKDGFTLTSTGREGEFLALKNGFQVTDIKSANAIVANNRVYIIDCCVVKYE